MFEVGTEVEVLIDAEDCRDVWFPAIIFDKLRNGSFLVECPGSKVGDEARPLKVTTDPLHVRPCPPLLKSKKLDLLEKVDASFDNGWWSGVITKELEDSRYLVFFKQMNKNREFHLSEIRPHMEWKDGKWITSSKDVSIPSSENGKQGSHICTNDTVVAERSSGNGKDKFRGEMPCSLNSLGDQMEQSTHRNLEPNVINPLTKSRHLSPSGSFDTFSQPLKKLKEGKAAASSLATHQQTMLETPSKAVQDGSVSPTSGNTVTSSVKPLVPQDLSSNNPYWGRSQRKPGKQKNLTSSSMKKRGRTQTPQIGIPELFLEGKELNLVENAANIQKESVKGTGLGIVLGLECTELGSSRHKAGSLTGDRTQESHGKESLKPVSAREQLSNDLAIQNIKERKQSSGTEVNIQKRKRGRPRKILIKTPQTPVTGTTQKGDVLEDGMVTKDCTENEAGSHTSGEVEMSGMKGSVCNQEMTVQKDRENLINDLPKQKSRSVGMMKKTLIEVPGEKVAGMPTNPNEKKKSKRGKGRFADQNIASQYQEASRERTMDSNGIVNEAKKVVAVVPGTKLDNDPLSKWIEETQTATAFHGSEVLPTRTAEQCIQSCKKQNEIAVPSEQQSLPFVKNTMLWKMIESMEVFQRTPQNPHFKPLESYKESSREGLAIGYMVNFWSVVDKASRLQFDDPKSIMDDILETLVDLDRHGFDVQAVCDRITSLGSVKERQEKLRGQLEKINGQIVEQSLEVNKVEEEIDEINQQIRNLHEGLLVARSAKKKKNLEVASLQSKLQEVIEIINNVKDDFEGLAGAPL